MSPPDRPKLVDELEWHAFDGGWVAYHPRSDRVHSLNHTGAFILELCNGQHGEEEIAGIVQGAFHLGEPPLAEVKEIIQRAADDGLLD